MRAETRKVPITAGSTRTPPRRSAPIGVRVGPRPGSGFAALFVALCSIGAGVGCVFGAQSIGLVRLGQQRPVTSTLLAEAVAPWTSLSPDRVARIGEGRRPVANHAHLQIGYAISRYDGETLQIEARLEDRHSGEVLERFVTWRRR